jgi:hypothetical protein
VTVRPAPSSRPNLGSCSSKTFATLVVAVAGLLAACEGKGVGGSCADQAGCGGNLVGMWQVDGYCQYLVNGASSDPPTQPDLITPQTPSLATPLPTTSTGEWCQGLVVVPAMGGGVMVANTNFFPTPSQFVMGTVEFDMGGVYTFRLTSVATSHVHLTQSCIDAYGASTDCAGLVAALKAGVNPNYNKDTLTCNVATDGDGCDCDVQLGDSGFDQGTWALDTTQTVVYATSTNSGYGPRAASFCVNGDGDSHLTLSGYNGATLPGGPAGLRTLTATRIAP